MKRNAMLLVFAGVATALGPAHAGAQSIDPANRDAAISSVTSTTTTSMVAGIVITLILSSGEASIERYLRDNAVAVRADIATGAGATVADLAELFVVPADERDGFGAVLRASRGALIPLLEPHAMTRTRARAFIAVVQEARTAEAR